MAMLTCAATGLEHPISDHTKPAPVFRDLNVSASFATGILAILLNGRGAVPIGRRICPE